MLLSKKMTQNLMTHQDCVLHLPLRFLLPFQRLCWHKPCTRANLHLKGMSHTQDVNSGGMGDETAGSTWSGGFPEVKLKEDESPKIKRQKMRRAMCR